MSYATKYGILKTFTLESGEDEESRYQQEEFDITGNVEHILASENVDELQRRFRAIYKEAETSKDKDAMKSVIAAKDARKAQLVPA